MIFLKFAVQLFASLKNISSLLFSFKFAILLIVIFYRV